MLKRPLGVKQRNPVTGDEFPVPPPNWKYLCLLSDAEYLSAKILSSIPGSTCTVVDVDPDQAEFVRTFDQPRYYEIQGTIQIGPDNSCTIQETAGWLFDRQTKPEPFVDGSGGPNLYFKNYSGNGQLYWGK